LVVVDTGRHVEHSDQILAFAREQRRSIRAIVNTHWHLDHSSGNRRIKAAFPGARVYTTNAIDRALTTFLARSLERARARQAANEGTPVEIEERALFLGTMDHADSLRPDVVLSQSGPMRIGGKRFDVHVTNHAVSDADVWLYDRASRVAVVGDLATLPAPFFETACPQEWSEALDEVWATPFATVIPGHGAPMTRAQFDLYRGAFNAFMACVNEQTAAAECATGWVNGVASLEPDNARMHANAREYAEYYVGFLRENGGKSAECQLER
jgi:glyoxylase-like metal-dependent hydrolase (beta-lactamase superfamily II)